MSTQTTPLPVLSSPHKHSARSVTVLMAQVLLALLPGYLLLIYCYGWGYVIHLCLALLTALASEALVLRCRQRPIWRRLTDLSAVVTAALLTISLPPYAPWWLSVLGNAFAIIVVKQLYGGLGQNPFNPAMAAFALLLIALPVDMTTHWATASAALPPGLHHDLAFALQAIFQQHPIDGLTSATVLDAYKQSLATLTPSPWQTDPLFAGPLLPHWAWINLAFLLGGLWLLHQRIITWHIPTALLGALAVPALVIGSLDGQALPSLAIHLLGGASLLGAFFIATDPASAATSNRGKLIYAAGIGLLTYAIRHWGNYPDALAFAVLLMNFAAPLIDHYSLSRSH